ncbi:MAG: restriction endonuclease [Chloroflexus sp.]
MTRQTRSPSNKPSELDPLSSLLALIAIGAPMMLELSLWWKISLIGIGLTIVFFINRWLHEQRLQSLRRQQLLNLSPTEFEQRIGLLLEDLGWQQVTVRGGSGDRGVDITAERDGLRYIVQCKRYTKPVGPSYVRDLVGALQIQRADRAILVTTSTFSRQSRLEAKDQAVELWDQRILLQRIDEAEQRRAAHRPHRRKQTRLLLIGAFGINLVLMGLALLSSDPNVVASSTSSGQHLRADVAVNADVVVNTLAPRNATTLPEPTATLTPTMTPQPTATPKPTATPAPTATPVRPTATVFNGGNVRAAPNRQGIVLDQIHAYETVILLGRSADGSWLRIINPRQQEGWVHRSLLTLDPAIVATLPVLP